MKNFKDFLNEEIKMMKATKADRIKGESYVVHDGKSIVTYNKTRMDGFKRATAKEVAATQDNWVVASSDSAHDKGIK